MKKVSEETWKACAENLALRRQRGTSSSSNGINLYQHCVSKVHIGKTVLDVGCGSCELKKYLPEGTVYYGTDPFPLRNDIFTDAIEDITRENFVETVFCFAALDNCRDLELALNNMKRICKTNIVILTGIDIEPNEYHTLKISEQDIIEILAPMHGGYREMINENLLLTEFIK